MEKKDVYLFLSSIYNIQLYHIEKLKKEFGEIENLLKVEDKKILNNKKINCKLSKNIVKYKNCSRVEKLKSILSKKHIKYVCIEDDDYPKNLKHICCPPPILFYMGDISFINEGFNLAMVGSRTPTEYGVMCAKKFSKELSDSGVNIISGLAMGIDSISHLGCLNGKSKTAAVIGSPLDNILPKQNINVAKKILENNGAIISEYIIGRKVCSKNFFIRNRIVSGISDGLFIVEAAKRSGSMITCEYASNQGKDVFVVPGMINSLKSEGCNDLIKDGANMVTEVEDITGYYKFTSLNNRNFSIEYEIEGLNLEQEQILGLIKSRGNITIDEICDTINADISKVNSNINELLINEYIVEMDDKTYAYSIL